ncbi:MAG: hypothetical protein LBG17_09285 [Bacteroidales bacterium]|jgi:hypothetical protein|nr:hypothetical protein [Bacteroidales bacterium]
MKKSLFLITIATTAIIFSGCKKDREFIAPLVTDFNYEDKIDRYEFTTTSTESDLTYKWEVVNSTHPVVFNAATAATSYFLLPEISEQTSVDIKHTIANDKSSGTITKSVSLPALTWFRKYSFGTALTSEHSNNVGYDWYVDQGTTGNYSGINCGPACVTMAIKWANPDFTGTTEDARNHYLPERNGWWYTDDITGYLSEYNVPNATVSFPDADVLITQLDEGNIVILCLDMYYIRSQEYEQWPVDKFYSTNGAGWGHFIVVKGYKTLGDRVFLEAYDPYSLGHRYVKNNMFMGLDRLYRAEDIVQSADLWWKYAIVIAKHGAGGAMHKASMNVVPPQHIPRQKGR